MLLTTMRKLYNIMYYMMVGYRIIKFSERCVSRKLDCSLLRSCMFRCLLMCILTQPNKILSMGYLLGMSVFDVKSEEDTGQHDSYSRKYRHSEEQADRHHPGYHNLYNRVRRRMAVCNYTIYRAQFLLKQRI